MKTKILVLALSVALTGCATAENGDLTVGGADMGFKKSAVESVGIGGAIGCAGGAVVGRLVGASYAQGCALGAAVGGFAGYERYRQEDLKVAAAAAKEVPGLKVDTHQVAVTDKTSGQVKKVAVLKSMSIALPDNSMTDPNGRQIVQKLATKAGELHTDTVMTITGRAADVAAAKAELASAGTNSAQQHVAYNYVVDRHAKRMVIAISAANQSDAVTA